MPQPLKEDDELPMMTRKATIELKPARRAGAQDNENDLDDDPDADGNPDERAEMGQGDKETQDPGSEGSVLVGQGRAYPMSLSSETPVDQWFGSEVLDHSAGAVDLSRADGMPLLLDHDPRRQIGVVNNLKVAKDRTLRGDIVFSKSAQDIEQDVQDGIRRNMSVGYRVNQYDVERGKGNAPDTYTARSWQPMEASIVSIPADHTVGVGRSASEKFPVRVRSLPGTGANKGGNMPTTTESAPNKGADAAAIVRLAGEHGMMDRVQKWLDDGRTTDQVRDEILEARRSQPLRQPAAEEGAGLSEREAKQYSYARAIAMAADVAEGKRGIAGFEMDISQEMERKMPMEYKRHGGIFVPTSLRGIKAGNTESTLVSDGVRAAVSQYLTRAGGNGTIDSATANYIKEVVFTEYGGELINILRNTALVARMGARVLTGLSSPVGFPRQTADNGAVWQATENPGVNINAGQVSTDLVTLMPRTLMAATAYSRQLLVQSSVDVEAMVRESIAASHALAWDLAALHGSGSNGQPKGIYNTTGVNVEDFSTYSTPDMLNYSQLVDMEAQVANANALLGTLGWLTTPSVAKAGKTKLRFPNAAVPQGGEIWTGTILEGEMDGYKAMATNQVSKTMGANAAASGGSFHGLIFGNWSDLLIGQFGGAMELIVDPYSLKKQALIEVTSYQMTDVAIRHAVSFAVAANLNPSL